jgi:diguanylate cyclase (GGDEF)-like protein/PAS domain S-box-containing protein
VANTLGKIKSEKVAQNCWPILAQFNWPLTASQQIRQGIVNCPYPFPVFCFIFAYGVSHFCCYSISTILFQQRTPPLFKLGRTPDLVIIPGKSLQSGASSGLTRLTASMACFVGKLMGNPALHFESLVEVYKLSIAYIKKNNPTVLLLVDDEPNILQALRRLFHNENYEIYLASCGDEGLEILSRRPVDIIISDMHMPKMSGIEFLARTVEQWPETVRILLTGYADLQSAIDSVNKGKIFYYCNKPWNDEELKLLVRKALEQKHLWEERDHLSAILRMRNDEMRALNEHLEETVGQRTAQLQHTLSKFDQTNSSLKEQKEKLYRLNRVYAVLNRCNHTLIRARDEDSFLYEFCQGIVVTGNYLASWIDLADDNGEHPLQMQAKASFQAGDEYNDQGPPDLVIDGYPAVIALSQGSSIISRNMAEDDRFKPWRKELLRIGCRTFVCLLIKEGERVMGALSICAEEVDAFSDQEYKLFEELVSNLAFGMITLNLRAVKDELENTLLLRNRAIEAARNGIAIADVRQPGNPLVYANPAFTKITGYELTEVLGRSLAFLHGEEHEQKELQIIQSVLRYRKTDHTILRNFRKDGISFWNKLDIAPIENNTGEVTHFIGIIDDITELKTYQEQLEYQATHDELTGLSNRNLLNDRLNQAIASAQRHQKEIYLIFLDLDRFKIINDTLGHEAGDELLKEVAKRLQRCVRSEDTVARYGGDEFVLVLSQNVKLEEIVMIAKRLMVEITKPCKIRDRDFLNTVSMGISIYPHDAQDKETLLKYADIAMYEAKDRGRNTFCFYTEELNQRLMQRLTLEQDLRLALKMEQFIVYYQPKVDLYTGRISGMEALLRWNHPEKGMIPPDQFIPLAEEIGLIIPIGEWVVRTACLQAKTWQAAGWAKISMAVNVSPKQLHSSHFDKSLSDILEQTGLEACYLDLEVTEGAVMEDPEKMIVMLNRLKKIGVQISMDDFGTGYSSLSYLKRFPFDNLKIDKAFVNNIPEDEGDVTLVLTIIAMAHNFNLKVIAEGVEKQEQWDFLKQKNCDQIQGYFFSRPLQAQEAENLLRNINF